MKDFRGREIRVGSLIAWANRQGSSLWMNTGKIVNIDEKDDWGKKKKIARVRLESSSDSWQMESKKLRTVECLDRIVVLNDE